MARELSAKKHEFIGVLVLLFAVLLVVCLASYNSHDSSLDAVTRKPVPSNMAGRIGAQVSGRLFQFFGFPAGLLVIPFLVVGWKLMRGQEIGAPYLRATGLLLLMASIGTGLELAPHLPRGVGFNPGGSLGVLLAEMLLPNLNTVGTGIVVAGAAVLGLLAATSFSFQGVFGQLPGAPEARPNLWKRFVEWRQTRKPVRAVVNIKPPAPLQDFAPRPASVSTAASVPVVQPRPQTAPKLEGATESRPPVPGGSKSPRFLLPPIDILTEGQACAAVDEKELRARAQQLQDKCAEFDVRGSISQIHPGPVVTTFEFKPDAGIKYSKITSLVDDLCLGVKAESMRIDRIPGKATVGIEVPNPIRETIVLREVLESDAFRKHPSKLALALGKEINGDVYVTDLARMPHLLIAGATGAGKSVGLNCMITSILYKATPDEVRFILIDPKRLELGMYQAIPHLLTPIVTDPKEASNALRWATNEMETRYKRLALHGVRNIDQYNALIRSTGRQLSFLDADDADGKLEKPLPYLVLVIDELADLMMVSSREVEESISRLAAMARAVGIHLVLATQRPSVDVITGVIKANFPCRVAFKVATKVDSRTIIDSNGAEQLLGNGDLLFIPPGSSRLIRVHGAYVSEKETQAIVEHLRNQGRPAYDDSVLIYGQEELDEAGNPVEPGASDPLYNEAVRIVITDGRASTSLLQRRLSIGYGRAAKLIDMMHENRIVGPAEGSKPREVLVGLDFLDRLESN
jgi:DNA segregation ATPase FtsK/SpoIIIE, S-DNA-T family